MGTKNLSYSMLNKLYQVIDIAQENDTIFLFADFQDGGDDNFDELSNALSKKKLVLNVTSVELKPHANLIKCAEGTGGKYQLIYMK